LGSRAPLLRLPSIELLPDEQIEAAYEALLRLVVKQLREAPAANDNASASVEEVPT
jgi:hypothetical protein